MIEFFDTQEAWLAQRKNSIGASEIAACCSLDPYTSKKELLERKRTGETFAGNDDTDRGLFLEEGVARWWAKKRGAKLVRLSDHFGKPPGTIVQLRHPDQLCVTATPDFLAEVPGVGLCVVEVKVPRSFAAAKWPPGGPIRYQVQLNMQVGLAFDNGMPIETNGLLICAQGDDPPAEHVIPFNGSLYQFHLGVAGGCWRQMKSGEEIADTAKPSEDDDAFSPLGHCTAVPIDSLGGVFESMLLARHNSKREEEIQENAVKAIQDLMGEAEVGTINGKPVVSWKRVSRNYKEQKARTVSVREFRLLVK